MREEEECVLLKKVAGGKGPSLAASNATLHIHNSTDILSMSLIFFNEREFQGCYYRLENVL